tara:strand:- start:202 stop:453 length:252 start_codon:yes stop_codon:yes gene_type:complete
MTQDNLGIGSFSTPPIEGRKKRNEDLDKAFNEYKRQHDSLLQDYNKKLIGNDEFDNRFAEVRTIYTDTIEAIWASDGYKWPSS